MKSLLVNHHPRRSDVQALFSSVGLSQPRNIDAGVNTICLSVHPGQAALHTSVPLIVVSLQIYQTLLGSSEFRPVKGQLSGERCPRLDCC